MQILDVSGSLKMAANGQGLEQFDILPMKENEISKWQIATKPMLSVCIFLY